MHEVLPGIFTWSVVWPQWSLESYWLRFPGGSVLIDPMEAFGLDDITAADDVVAIVLTVGWHERQAISSPSGPALQSWCPPRTPVC